MIHEPKLLADAAERLTKVADLAVHGSIPRPIQDFMVEVPILAALRATYGCGNARAMVYKSHNSTSTGPHRYCPRCDRAYDLEDNEQVPNWAYRRTEKGFERNTREPACS